MKLSQIILISAAIFSTASGVVAQQPVPGAPTVAAPYGAPPSLNAQNYLQPSPGTAPPVFVQQTPSGVPIYPPGAAVALPGQTPGSIFGPPGAVVTVPQGPGAPEQLPAPPGYAAPGTQPPPPGYFAPGAQVPPGVLVPGAAAPPPAAVVPPPSMISVPVVDEEYAWDQITDVVTDYFKIAREQRARRGSAGFCEGRIDTVPRDSATVLEPFRNDSIGTFNRWESTFQTIRRRATVRVIPDPNGYQVEVIVVKEREDLPRPERATASRASFSDNAIDISLPSDRTDETTRISSSPRWLSLGRDPLLEQRMLAEIQGRLNGVVARGSALGQ
ncbi:MAG TPA: hypothetical protein VH107_08745 [Lacipirellulaceae bacterium]|jgi:hypothetical protein|nr:hypothetical protein [Lacipirellulaceae bacterium]